VFIGLISYPLHLFHQPLLALIAQGQFGISDALCKLLSISLTLALSVLTYRYLENPIRSLVRNKQHAAGWITTILVVGVITTGAIGLVIAKTNGFSQRFDFLNPFASTVIKSQESTFRKYFSRGIQLKNGNHRPRVLFVGDSVLQQYVVPLMQAWQLEESSINTITRGGCILLPGTPFNDTFADISQSTLMRAIENLEGEFDAIVISQRWESYQTQSWRTDISENNNTFLDWYIPLEKAINFYKQFSKKIIVIGPHINVAGTEKLKPSISLTKDSYASGITGLFVQNESDLEKGKGFFKAISNELDCIIIYPEELFRGNSGKYKLHDKSWSYFSDQCHISEKATDHIEKQLIDLIESGNLPHLID
jgi:hypothetical protein